MPAPVMAVHLQAGAGAAAVAAAHRGDSKPHSCYRWQQQFGGERSRERESERKMAAAAAVPVAGPFRGRNAVVVSSHKVVALHAASTRWPGSGSGSVWSRSRSRSGVCRCRGSAGSEGAGQGEDAAASSSGSNSESAGEGGSAAGWDLAGSSKKMQAAAAKMSDPLREMMTTASKRLQDYLDNHRLSKLKGKAKQAEAAVEAEPEPENESEKEPEPEVEERAVSEWDRWQTLFAEVEERESLASALKFQLEDAVERQDYAEAAKLKHTMAGVSAGDAVAEVMKDLERALQEERYGDAARLRDKAGAGLVGWWSGLGDGGSDPFGRLVSIVPMQGRLVAKSYTARQLASGSPGIPLFEVFVNKSKSGEYELQAVYLQREGTQAVEATPAPVKEGAVNVVEVKNVVVEGEGDKKPEDSAPESTEKREPEESDVNEGLKVVINFLKGRIPDLIPDLKLNVFQVVAPEGVDIPKIVEQIMEPEQEEEKDNEEANTSGSGSDKEGNVEEGSIVLDEKIPSDFLSEVTRNGEQKVSVRLLLGGVLQNNGEDKVPKLPVRVPATIEAKSRDSFVFNIDDTGLSQTPAKEIAPSWKVAAVATRASAGLMPDDVAKVFWNVDKVPVKVSKEMGEMIRLAVSQAQRRHGLQKITNFTRINTQEASSDPLCGLYIGAFGPYTSEVVQVKRKYGCWQDAGAQSTGEKLEFFEYVEAVKLTGDLNVPAGQVTFRAKTGRENRLSHRTSYPEELGVVARFKGQGRLAEPGFRNPHWIDGDLILLDGKSSHTNGAELGFVYSATERNFLILFNRLKLQN